LEVTDDLTDKRYPFRIPVTVLSSAQPPRVVGTTEFTVRGAADGLLTLVNDDNSENPLLLRVAGRPPGLAARILPDEFTLAPFESRSVSVELLNLGVASGNYTLRLENAASNCPSSVPDCGHLSDLAVHVVDYRPPVARIGGMPEGPVPAGTPVAFRDDSVATGSQIVAWTWRFGDGSISRDQDPTHVYLRPGVFTVGLEVVDAYGRVARSDDAFVIVANDPPNAVVTLVAAPDGWPPTAGRPLNLTAASSLDPDGPVATYTWAFGDGNLAQGVNVTHTYAKAGTYRVTLAVEDAFGAVAVGVLEVHVAEASPPEAGGGLDAPGDPPGAAGPAWFAAAAALAMAVLWGRRTPRRPTMQSSIYRTPT
jgi:hypothetical protein